MSQPKVLIAGASVAGPVLAYWLVKSGCEVTVIERSPEIRIHGQSVDIRNDGIKIMRQMGIEQLIRDKTSGEKGMSFTRADGKVVATLGATGDEGQQSITTEFEIFRGDLAKILIDRTREKVKYIFGDYIESISQNEKAHTVTVGFHSGNPAETYDLVVGCDGMSSRTRALAFNIGVRDHLKTLNLYAAWFTVKKDLLNGSQNAQWINFPGGKCLLLRPDPSGDTRAGFDVCGPKGKTETVDKFLDAEKTGGKEAVKKLMAETFLGTGSKSDICIEAMATSEDFWCGEWAQVQLPTLSRGRVTLCGDAGYCPSPVTGSGTTLAFTGAYLLAGEINTSLRKGEDLDEALKRYDEKMLPRVRKTQELPLGLPNSLNPQTKGRIALLHWILWAFVTFRIWSLVEKLSGVVAVGGGLGLEEYEWAN